MENNLKIDINEVLRYLGYRGQEITNELMEEVEEAIKESKSLLKVKYVCKEFKITKNNSEILLEGTNLRLKGKDIFNLLQNSDKCILMAATVGSDIERKIKFYSKINLTKALILDSCATAAIEEVCNNLQESIGREMLKGEENFTFRYSPGYGDLSLDIQKDFISVLDCERKIGLKVSSDMLLFPRKSVTAILGITNKKQNRDKCKECSNFERCNYRKGDKRCGC